MRRMCCSCQPSGQRNYRCANMQNAPQTMHIQMHDACSCSLSGSQIGPHRTPALHVSEEAYHCKYNGNRQRLFDADC